MGATVVTELTAARVQNGNTGAQESVSAGGEDENSMNGTGAVKEEIKGTELGKDENMADAITAAPVEKAEVQNGDPNVEKQSTGSMDIDREMPVTGKREENISVSVQDGMGIVAEVEESMAAGAKTEVQPEVSSANALGVRAAVVSVNNISTEQ